MPIRPIQLVAWLLLVVPLPGQDMIPDFQYFRETLDKSQPSPLPTATIDGLRSTSLIIVPFPFPALRI